MAARHIEKGKPVHDAEARGIQALVRALPDHYTVFSNIELPSDRRGQTFEHDAVVVAPHAVFTVELKSWGGRIVGNRDRWTLADGFVVPSPIPLILSKARTLKGRLTNRRRDLTAVWVQGMVFLSAADASPHITADFEDYVVNLDTVRTALTDPGWLGHPTAITSTQRRAIEDYLHDGQAPKPLTDLEDFRLVQRLAAEDRPYEAWLAERSTLIRERRILHVYTVAGESDAERDRLRAHALREATLHARLRGGKDILRYDTYVVTRDDPQRIVLQFEDTTPLQPMDVWAKEKNPGLAARLAVASRVARALAWVHEKGLVHRRLSPEAVLVSNEDAPTEVRLCAFELARDLTGVAATITGSSLGDPTFRCAAPEVLRTAEATPRSDLFSLGATIVELFNGRSLFANVDEVLRPFAIPPLSISDTATRRTLTDLAAELLAVDPSQRPAGAAAVAERLEHAHQALTHKPARTELAPGAEIRQTYELVERLGRGATATTWKARHLQTDQIVVLKIADPEHAHYLQEEGRVLGSVHHTNLVRFHNVEPFEGGNLLVLEYVDGYTASLWAGAGDPLEPQQFLAVAKGLLGALGALHQAGWVHRDVKPDNVMLSDAARPKLLDLGLAKKWPVEGDLAVGSVRYKDPLVYVLNRWSPENDLFSACLVLYEILTGTHPFGGSSPEPNQAPTIQTDEFPETFAAPLVDRLSEVFRRALSPVADDRPKGVEGHLRYIEEAIGAPPSKRGEREKPSQARQPSAPPPPLPASLELSTPLSELDTSVRAEGALARLGLTVVADLVGFEEESVRGLSNVGSKTIRELRALAVQIAERWPAEAKFEHRPAERFYPALADDIRSLDALGLELQPKTKEMLVARGVFTVGDLASMPPRALETLPSVGPKKVEQIRRALRRLAGREELPETLKELDDLLRAEVGDAPWKAIVNVVGLQDGQVRSITDAGAAIGVSRQRVSQAADLIPLRADASWGHHLVTVVTDALPPAGFARLGDVAAAIATRLPTTDAGPSPLGYARLAALLLLSDARATDASEIRWVFRPPWTEERIADLEGRLGAMANWPPIARGQAQASLWDAASVDGSEELQRALVRWGADASHLLDALLKLEDGVQLDRTGGLYTPPVELKAGLSLLRPSLTPVVEDTPTLITEVQSAFAGVVVPPSAGEVRIAIEAAGYRADGDHWIDSARIDPSGEVPAPRIDPTIPTQRVAEGAPPVVAALASQRPRGGFRVVALPPEAHHKLAHRLASWLGEAAGAERVRYVAVDRLVIEALKTHDLWKFVPFIESQADPDYRMFHAELAAALEEAMKGAAPGQITVLGQTSLLGSLGLMDWLSGFYERARGGKHGLVVLAVPGGIHEDRVRLNEKYNLPYTPDMAAVYLEAS